MPTFQSNLEVVQELKQAIDAYAIAYGSKNKVLIELSVVNLNLYFDKLDIQVRTDEPENQAALEESEVN
ncbi:MAG: hypothetical protein ACRC80_22730 [Waterburya sp.]